MKRLILVFPAVLTLLLAGDAPTRAADEVLAPGDPPLMKESVAWHRDLIQWLLDVRMTPEQQEEFEQVFVKSWNKQNKLTKQSWLKDLASDRAWWERVKKLTPSNQDRERRVLLE
jgi:hypothetical protein